jgi:hypothetical protein
MTGEVVVSLIIGILGFISGVASPIFARRKVAAEREKILAEAEAIRSGKENTDVDAFDKFSDMLKKLQDRNADLYTTNIELEKKVTERDRSLEVLTDRLKSRDAQLEQSVKQLELLRNLAKDSPVIETLKVQLEAMNVIALSLQTAQTEGQKILLEKEKSMHELLTRTNRDLELQKPPKS